MGPAFVIKGVGDALGGNPAQMPALGRTELTFNGGDRTCKIISWQTQGFTQSACADYRRPPLEM